MPDRELGLHSLPTSSGSSHGEPCGTEDKFAQFHSLQYQPVPLAGDCDSLLNYRATAQTFPNPLDPNAPYYQPPMPYSDEPLDLAAATAVDNSSVGLFSISPHLEGSLYHPSLAAQQNPAAAETIYAQSFIPNVGASSFEQYPQPHNQFYAALYADAPNYNGGYNNVSNLPVQGNFSMPGTSQEMYNQESVDAAPDQFSSENYNYTPMPIPEVSHSISSDMIPTKHMNQDQPYIDNHSCSISTIHTSSDSYQESYPPQLSMDMSYHLESSFSPRPQLARHNSLVASASSDSIVYRQMENDMLLARGKARHKQVFANSAKKNLVEISGHRSSFLNTFLNPQSSTPLIERFQDTEQPLPLDGFPQRQNVQIDFVDGNNYRVSTQSTARERSESLIRFNHAEPRTTNNKKAVQLSKSRSKPTSKPRQKPGEVCKIVRLGLGGPKAAPDPDAKFKYLRLKINITNASIEEINNIPWTDFELKEGRRIVRMERRQNMANIFINFSVVTPNVAKTAPALEPEGAEVVEVSVIRSSFKQSEQSNKKEYFLTSVEFIEMIECLIGCRNMEHHERRRERGRIRLNLMKYWLKTPLPSKKSLDSGEHDLVVIELALKIRKYSLNKLPGFNKEVRIMPWDKLIPALNRALEYYYAEVPNDGSDDSQSK